MSARQLCRQTIAFCTLLSALAAPAAAQTATPRLSDQVLERPAIGLTTSLPMDVSVTTYQISGTGISRITLPNIAALINISDRRLTEPKTPREIADSIINDNLASVSSLSIDTAAPNDSSRRLETAKGRVLSHETRDVGGWPAEVFYLQLAGITGEDAARGYAVFMPTPTSAAIYELQTSAHDLAAAKPYFEMLVDSTRIVDPAAIDAQRGVGVEAGLTFMQSLEPADYEKTIRDLGDQWRFERFYKPAESGADRDAEELGYRMTKYSIGTRGDLKSETKRTGSSPADRQKGYLVHQRARLLLDDRLVDIDAAFFMTPDRTSESWTIRQTVRPLVGTSKVIITNLVETAVRDRSDLFISRTEGSNPPSSIRPAIEGAGYISRLETYLMPYLLMHQNATGSHRFYAFNQRVDRVTLREDILTPRKDSGFKYVSRPSEGHPGQTVLFDAKGQPVRADLPGNQVWEPITGERLLKIWKDKNLPVN
ncbi:MAG: hypothetical protein Q9O74_01235 [Planctomycetota bacterium]|nr:hypothetical protein [Planctomycetota bacterium]